MLNANRLLLLVIFASGAVSLSYEILWLKDLGFLLGSSAYASAITLGVFFLGLALGSWSFGHFLPRMTPSLKHYGVLEAGIGLSAALYLWLNPKLSLLFAPKAIISQGDLDQTLLLKTIMVSLLLLLPTFFMGGTIPLAIAILQRTSHEKLASQTARLYATNILGGIFGVIAAGFVLPWALGFSASYQLMIILNLVLAAVCWLGPAVEAGHQESPVQEAVPTASLKDFFRSMPALLAFVSGLATLGLEVLWTQMFSLVTINCVYSFAIILAVFLTGLSFAGFLASRLRAGNWSVEKVLFLLTSAAFIAVACSPLFFFMATGGYSSVYEGKSWAEYISSLLVLSLMTIMAGVVASGIIFPYLLTNREHAFGPTAVGRLLAVNTIGAITGSAVAGFIVLPVFGIWNGILLFSGFYLLAALAFLFKKPSPLPKFYLVPLVVVAVLVGLIVQRLPHIRLNPANAEKLAETWFGPHGSTTVISATIRGGARTFDDLFIRLNNFYTLGGLGSRFDEARQAELPLFVAAKKASVFIIGLATGITAGAALNHPTLDRLVVAELVPEVATAAQKYFSSYSNQLFSNEKVQILIDDGRSILSLASEKYDVVVADLFKPWGAGTGTLYTKEHFELIKSRLHDDGVFVQWLPLYQLTEDGFGMIARSALAVFPEVTLWRGNFNSDKPIVALFCRKQPQPLDPNVLLGNVRDQARDDASRLRLAQVFSEIPTWAWEGFGEKEKAFLLDIFPQISEAFPFTYYAGNLSARPELFSQFEVNTQARPVFEYSTPQTLGRQASERNVWMTRERLASFLEKLFHKDDPYLAHLSEQQKGYVEAGLQYYRYFVASRAAANGSREHAVKAKEYFDAYKKLSGLTR